MPLASGSVVNKYINNRQKGPKRLSGSELKALNDQIKFLMKEWHELYQSGYANNIPGDQLEDYKWNLAQLVQKIPDDQLYWAAKYNPQALGTIFGDLPADRRQHIMSKLQQYSPDGYNDLDAAIQHSYGSSAKDFQEGTQHNGQVV